MHSPLIPSDGLLEERFLNRDDLFEVPVLDKRLIYAPMHRIIALLDEEEVQEIKARASSASTSAGESVHKEKSSDSNRDQSWKPILLSQNLRNTLDKLSKKDPTASQNKKWKPTSVTFSNTQKCTLRCTYCYADGGRLDDAVIPKEVADAAIDLIIHNSLEANEEPRINFLGEGEATADWRTFTYIIDSFLEKARLNHLKPHVELSTNGVFSSDRIDYLSRKIDIITFSLDGLPESHDKTRVLPNGSGSFERIIEVLREFDHRNKSYSIRSTATSAAVEKLPEFIEFIGCNLKTKNVHIEPAFDMTSVAITATNKDMPKPYVFIEQFRKARRIASKYGISLYYSGADTKTRDAFCGVSGARNMIVTSKGIITSCNEVLRKDDPRAPVFQYGAWNKDSKSFDIGPTSSLDNIKVDNIPKCQGCFAKYNCAGDCYAKTMVVAGDIYADKYTDRCIIARELLMDNLMIEILKGMNA